MRSPASAITTAINAARDSGLIIRWSVTIWPKDRETGVRTAFGFWTGDDPITTSVISGSTGNSETRSYYGGVNLSVPPIPRTSDLTVQSFEISLSQIADAVQTVLRGYDARLAPIEVHVWVLGASGAPVSAPEPEFIGIVDEAGITTPVAGGDGKASMTIVSEAMLMLTRKNPRKRSDEGQKRRSGDRFGRYSNTAGYTRVYWGEDAPKDTTNPPKNGGGDK